MSVRDEGGAGADLKEIHSASLCKVNTLTQNTGMNPLLQVTISLLQHLPDENDAASGSVAAHVVLRSGSACDHGGGRILNLHLVKQGFSIFSDLDVATAAHKHLQSALGAEVGLQHLLHSLSCIHVHGESDAAARHLAVLIQHLDCGHCCFC